MKDARAALRYAKAILNLAKDSKSETAVNDDMSLIAATIAENKDLEVMLKSPIVKVSDKMNVLNALFDGKVNTITLGLFHLLKDNKRIAMLKSIARKYAIVFDHLKHTQAAVVTTAVALTEEIEKLVLDKIVALTGKKSKSRKCCKSSYFRWFYLTCWRCAVRRKYLELFKRIKKGI